MATKKTSVETSAPVRMHVPKHGGGRLRIGGKPGNKGGGRKPAEYIEFLRTTLDSEKHRDVLTAKLTEDSRDFLHATELAAGYVHGKPAATVTVNAAVTVIWDI